MTKPRMPHVFFWMLAAVTLVLFGFFVALLAGAIPVGPPAAPADTGAFFESRTEPAEEPPPTTAAKRVRRMTSTSTSTATATATLARTRTAPPTPLATIVVTAVRGDCWISARLGSENGRVLEERLLAQGESVRLRGARVWLSAGAAANVDITVDGEAREIRSGTVTVVLGPA